MIEIQPNYFRNKLVALNYTNTDTHYKSLWYLELDKFLGAVQVNITSRIMTFADPEAKDEKVSHGILMCIY